MSNPNIKYKVIAKVGNKDDGKAKTIKYNYVNNLKAFADFLDNNFPGWTWMNVFNQKREQLASFTKFKKPTSAKLAFNK